MKAGEHLHELIHSMTPGEKRYFRAYAQRHVLGESNSYFRLFQAINRQERFDEGALIREFAGEAWVRQFSVARHYLSTMLLRSLREYHRGETPEMKLREWTDHIDLLFSKGLFGQCHKLLRKAVKLATEQEAYLYLHQFKVLEKRLLKRTRSIRDFAELEPHSEAERHYLQLADRQSQLRHLHDRVFGMVSRIGLLRTPEQEAELQAIMEAPILAKPEHVSGFESKIIYHYIHAYAARLKGQPGDVLPHYRAMLELWERAPKRREQQPDRYLRTLIAHLETQFQTGQYQDFEEVLSRLREVPARESPLKAQVFYFSHLLKLRHCMIMARLEEARSLLPEIQTGLQIHGSLLSPELKVVLHFNLASLFLLSAQPRECLRWINLILNEGNRAVRADILRAARMFNLLVHYELDNTDYLESLFSSNLRYLKVEKGDHAYEKALTEAIRSLVRTTNSTRPWSDLKDQLQSILTVTDQPIPGSTEINGWLEARGQGVPLPEWYQASLKNNS